MNAPMMAWAMEGGRLKLANLVTLSRAVLVAPVLILLLLGHPRWALAVYLAACATDILDGWLARRMGQASAFGAQLDAGVDQQCPHIVEDERKWLHRRCAQGEGIG